MASVPPRPDLDRHRLFRPRSVVDRHHRPIHGASPWLRVVLPQDRSPCDRRLRPGDAASAGALRQWTKRWIERTGLAKDATLAPYSWPIPSLSERDIADERASGPRWMLVGDAAGLVDPITREGIFFALQSADAAATAIAAGGNAARRYDAALRRLVYPELARAAQLKARFFEPRFLRLLVQALHRPSIARSWRISWRAADVSRPAPAAPGHAGARPGMAALRP